MDKSLLSKHIKQYLRRSKEDPEKYQKDLKDRTDRVEYYQSCSKEKITQMDKDELYEYISKLWAMLIWGNKHYYVDKLINDNGFENLKSHLVDLVWGDKNIDVRWDSFRKAISGLGPAMISEILCHVHPQDCMVWNRRAYVAMQYLGFDNLPRYSHQITGKVYLDLSQKCKKISDEFKNLGFETPSLLTVDYFFWDELQVEDNLSKVYEKTNKVKIEEKSIETDGYDEGFIHNDIRDKVVDIGAWLGFNASKEKWIGEGAKVDAIWEATIGNMGRVIYVFEVQTKGSIDSLILNLIKSLNNSSVQGVVAISDSKTLDKIKKQVDLVPNLKDKIRYWNYQHVITAYENLEVVNEIINELNLVPQGF